MFTPRLKEILLILLKEKEPVSIRRVAEELGVSKRTVQRELEYINSSLRHYELSFYSKTGTGVWLEGANEERERLKQELSQGDDCGVFDREERRKRLILELLRDKSPKKLFYFSSLLNVSEATVSNDLDVVEGWFEKFHLKINRKQGYGVGMEGEEKDYRRAMRAFWRKISTII